MPHYADVVLPLAVPGAYTYRISPTLGENLVVGSRVVVPLGKSKRYTGIVIRLHDGNNTVEAEKIKDIEELVDEHPLLLPQQIELWRWMAQYYLCCPGEVMKAALPAGLKLESETLLVATEDADPDDEQLTKTEQALLRVLSKAQSLQQVRKALPLPGLTRAAKHLIEKGWIEVEERVSQSFKSKTTTMLRLADAYHSEEALLQLDNQLKRAERQREALLAFLDMAGIDSVTTLKNFALLQPVQRHLLQEQLGDSTTGIPALVKRGVLETYNVEVGRLKLHKALPESLHHPLSEPQQKAHDEIVALWEKQRVVLLHGVTSSGKTEVYIQLIKETIARGQQVLFLLPEIALTTQITDRLGRVFGEQLGVYHSKFPDNERVELWRKQLSDAPFPLILGVRSSLFLPFQNLGLVIIDEEHESSYKQQDPAPRYHARDTAILMAHQAGAKVLLGTATPSVETYAHAQEGKYGYVAMNQRFGEVAMPEIVVEDVAELRRKRLMPTPFSPRLRDEIEAALQQGQQAIVFLNRRGYSPVLQCRSCGWSPHCTRCDVPLTLHLKMNKMVCHYCGTHYDVPTHCPQCEQADLRDMGAGTEKIEAAIETCFPQAKVGRMDLDTTRSRSAYERIIRDFQHGQTNLLVGTQMVTKGLDFGGVSVVGIINADQLLNQCDFRAHERAFQMLSQVAGRAGRRGKQGHVVLQTRQAKLPVVQQIVAGDYGAMFRQEMRNRHQFRFPPVVRLIAIYLKHREERVVAGAARQLAAWLQPQFGEDLLGPDRPHVGYVQLLHIRKILLKVDPSRSATEVRQMLRAYRDGLIALPQFRNVTLYFDVDPV